MRIKNRLISIACPVLHELQLEVSHWDYKSAFRTSRLRCHLAITVVGVEKVGATFEGFWGLNRQLSEWVPSLLVPMQWPVSVAWLAVSGTGPGA